MGWAPIGLGTEDWIGRDMDGDGTGGDGNGDGDGDGDGDGIHTKDHCNR